MKAFIRKKSPALCFFTYPQTVSVPLYGCTTQTLMKCLEKKLTGNSARMQRVVLNKSWKQHSAK